MDVRSMFATLDRILESSRVAILATVDEHGAPSMRWMTPALLRGRDGLIFTVTGKEFRKVHQINAHQNVQWIFQSKALDEILTANGVMSVHESPRTKAEVLEAIGRNMSVFWKINQDRDDFVVLETEVKSFEHFKPLTGEKTTLTV